MGMVTACIEIEHCVEMIIVIDSTGVKQEIFGVHVAQAAQAKDEVKIK
jgi:hypothetical protein